MGRDPNAVVGCIESGVISVLKSMIDKRQAEYEKHERATKKRKLALLITGKKRKSSFLIQIVLEEWLNSLAITLFLISKSRNRRNDQLSILLPLKW